MIYAEIKNNIDEDICILLKISNHKWSYICECGQASGLTIADCVNTNAIFISHTHIDHFVNFDTIVRHQLGIQRKVTICGPTGIAKNVVSKLHGYTWNLIKPDSIKYEIREIGNGNTIEVFETIPPEWNLTKISEFKSHTIFSNMDFFVKFIILDHKLPSVAYLFHEHDKINIKDFPFRPGKWIKELKHAYENKNDLGKIMVNDGEFKAKDLYKFLYVKKGYSTGIIMDYKASMENSQKIIKLFRDVDEVFAECYYRDIDHEFALRNHHSTARESGKTARQAGIKKITPVHFSRRYGDEIEDLKEECIAEFENRAPCFKNKPASKFDE